MNKVLIVIPAYNEEKIIGQNIKKLYDYAAKNLSSYDFKIVVADNNSSDQTGLIIKNLSSSYPKLGYEQFEKKGKGLAVMSTWQKYKNDFDVFFFMDADLATDLDALPKLLTSLSSGNDLAIGSRYAQGAQVKKPVIRRFFSLAYRLLLYLLWTTKIKDFPCGFKAINKKTLEQIIPEIKNDQFFFDSEMLYLAEKSGLRIEEIPIVWHEPRNKKDSKVSLLSVSWRYLKEAVRVKKTNNPDKLLKTEKRYLWLVSIILAIVTIIPTIYGHIISGNGYYSGLHLWFFDGNVYLSYINQIKDGNFLVHNLFSNELNNIPIFSLFWLCIGLMARLFGLSAPMAFQVARIVFIPVFVFSLYKIISYFLDCRSIMVKKICLIYSLTAAGLGGYWAVYDKNILRTDYFPMDILVPETVNFQLLFDSAHFIVSLTLLMLALFYFFKSVEERTGKYALISGVLSLILLSFHPYYFLTIFTILAIYLAYIFIKNKKIDGDLVVYYILVGIISSPSLFYYAYLFLTNEFFRIKSAQNLCGTPLSAGIFIGYGLPLIIAVIIQVYFVIDKKLDNKKIFLMIWFWSSIFLLHFPVVFQRRLSEGFQIPILLLSFFGLLAVYDYIKKYDLLKRVGVCLFLIAYIPLFCFSNIYVYYLAFDLLSNTAKKIDFVYVDNGMITALNWYKQRTGYQETLLCAFGRGATIPAQINRRVYFGHGMETVNAIQKGDEVEAFYKDNINDEQKKLFIKNSRIDYVFYSSLEKVIGTFDPYSKDYLELLYINEQAAIFQVKQEKIQL